MKGMTEWVAMMTSPSSGQWATAFYNLPSFICSHPVSSLPHHRPRQAQRKMSGTSTPRSGTMTPAVEGAEGYLLLTIQNVVVQQVRLRSYLTEAPLKLILSQDLR